MDIDKEEAFHNGRNWLTHYGSQCGASSGKPNKQTNRNLTTMRPQLYHSWLYSQRTLNQHTTEIFHRPAYHYTISNN